MSREIASCGELMRLYENTPDLIFYKSDLIEAKRSRIINEIVRKYRVLNPIDIVLESLVNVLSETLSYSFTQSRNVILLDKSIREDAIRKITDFIKNDNSFLKCMHSEWFDGVRSFLVELSKKGVETTQEAAIQLSLRFRISSVSSLRVLRSLM